ncbi:radical SAM/SPASM domain-containing protein [Flexibacterium corallicola]|uniref:radical SAM/SPASM domain-containing protein n=1 Tax=Flexibacterium corallicola TaxID=3037259 RepID=UPI00286ED9A0|nr:radical SAM protein [Pseudovibrio sp. M1P-2-3]
MPVVYLKPTNRCTIGCSHCFLPESVRMSKEKMSEKTLHKVGYFLSEAQKYGDKRTPHIIWHGGEPLSLSANYLSGAVEILKQYLPKFTQSIQTSLIPLKDEHIPFIKKNLRSRIGSSIDFGPRKLNGSVSTYHDIWLKKVEKARSADIEVIPTMVACKHHIGHELQILDWMVSHHFKIFSVERYNNFSDNTISVDRPSNKEHAQFLNNLFDALMERMRKTGSSPLVGAIKAAIYGIIYGLQGDRWGGGCQTSFIVIEPDGSLNSCPDRSSFEEAFSNVTDGYTAFIGSSLRRKWTRYQTFGHRNSNCSTCENSSFCKSGCPITSNNLLDEGNECSGYYSHLKFIRGWLEVPGNKELALTYCAQA